MIVSMRLPKIVSFSLLLTLLTSIAAGLSVLNSQSPAVSPAWTMISRFIVMLVFAAFGLSVAQASELRGSLFVTSEEWAFGLRDFVNYGVLPGDAEAESGKD